MGRLFLNLERWTKLDLAMKKRMSAGRVVGLLISILMMVTGCVGFEKEGSLTISFDPESIELMRKSEEVPALCDFYLEVVGSKGKTIYSGKFGEAPDKMMVAPGSYNISVRSRKFTRPAFSSPQYGDDQLVMVSSGEEVGVLLKCVMVNAGIRLRMGPEFLSVYPHALVFIECAGGKLNYPYAEKRVAYFPAGEVTVFLDLDGKRKNLFTRKLVKREVLDIRLVVPGRPAYGKEVEVELDTSKFWIDERFSIGGPGGGSGSGGSVMEDALSVGMARTAIGRKDVWVYGYIVGCMSGSRLLMEEPFSVSSNLVIASNRHVDEREAGLAVELRKKEVREALNLEDHPELLGKMVYLRGDLVDSYYGDAGIKSVDDFSL